MMMLIHQIERPMISQKSHPSLTNTLVFQLQLPKPLELVKREKSQDY